MGKHKDTEIQYEDIETHFNRKNKSYIKSEKHSILFEFGQQAPASP